MYIHLDKPHFNNSHKFAIFTTSVRPKTSICLWWIFTRGAFRARNAIKKVHDAAKTGSVFFPSRAPLSRWETARESGHSVCELLTTRSCIRCTRCIHTHTPSHLVAHCTNEHAKFPHRRDERIFAIGCLNPVGPPSTTWEVFFRKLIRTKKYCELKNYKVRYNQHN